LLSPPGAASTEPAQPATPKGSTILESCLAPEQRLSHYPTDKLKKPVQDDLPKPLILPQDKFKTSLEERGLPYLCVRNVNPDKNKPYIALTFDLCESSDERAGYDAAIVNYLQENQIPATFFAGGKWMRSHPERTMQLMADGLFEIGNHSWSHENLRVIKDHEEIKNQILLTQAQYKLLWNKLVIECGEKFPDLRPQLHSIPSLPQTFRFPYGACSRESLQAVNDAGLVAVQWNVVSGDPDRNLSAAEMAKRIVDQVKPGSIIIAHANGRGWRTAEALPRFVPKLKEKGYKFVKISELLKAGKTDPVETCYENTPGDNLRYDKYFAKKKQ